MKFRFQYDQEKVHWQLEKQSLEERISTLKKDLEESKAALLENLASSTNEEKSNKKKMEMWFKRRLDAIEHHILDLKTTPNDDSKFDKLLTKVRRLKHKQPWNGPRKPNLMLDDVALNQKSEIYSNGTSTPYSHYVCVLSSAASENNPLDKGFLCSINNSVPATHKSNHSFLSGPLSKSINTSKQAILESVVKKLHDSKLSFTAKEKLFCDIFKQSPCANDALHHVKLEDILNAANISKSLDSLSLDHSKCGKPTFKFNQKMRFDDLKDTKLEKVISTIPSQGSQKSSDLFGNSLRRSKSFDGKRALFFGSPDANLEHLINLDMSSHQKESGLDQGIIQEISEQLAGGQESRNLLASLQKLLSPTSNAIVKNLSQKLNFHEEEFGSEILKNDKDLDLSLIEEKKEEIHHNERFFDKLISDSFLVDGNDDIIKDFLSNNKTNENFNILDSDQKMILQEPQSSNNKAVGVGRNLLNNFLEEEEEEPIVPAVFTEKPSSNIKQNLHIDIEKIEGNHRMKDNKSPEEIHQEVVSSLNKAKKTTEVPSLNFNLVKENFQKHISKAMPPVIIIDTPVNQSNFQDKKSFKTLIKEEEGNKPPLSIETPTNAAEESPMTTPAGIFKANFKMKFGNIDKDYQSQQLYNCPSRSIDEQQLIGLPKPPMGSRKRTHQRPNLSLVEDNIKQNIYGKPKPDGDISLDVEYQFQYQEQEGEPNNFHSNNQAKKSIITDLSSHNQKAADYKNGRNSWSFSIEQEQKFVHPPKVELHNLNSLIGRNTHTRKTSDACPPRRAENQAYFVRSSYAQNIPQISQSNTPHPFSLEENNLLSNKSVLESENMNILKKVIPHEKPKQNIAPGKLSFEQYKASVKLLGNENIAPENNNQPKKPNPTNKGGDIYQAYRERVKDLRPVSPLGQNRDSSLEFKLALPLQKKPKIQENREKTVTNVSNVSNISNSNSSINGSAQFRARMFAHKKA